MVRFIALQRAVGLADVMSRGARIFSDDAEAAPAYARSRAVPRFNFFISHSWSASRWDKYAALLYRFNLVPALVAMHLASLLTCALFAAGLLPPMGTVSYAEMPGVRVNHGVYCQVRCVHAHAHTHT
jgi:hypothetical protein